MKTLMLIATSFIYFSCNVSAKSKVPEKKPYIKPYEIVSTEKDSKLDENHAVFELQFDEWLKKQQPQLEIELSCNGVINRFNVNAKNQEITVSPGSYIFQLAAGEQFEEIFTDSIFIHPGYRTIIKFHFRSVEEVPVTLKKPVIYTYSDREQNIDLTIDPLGELTFTYPQAENGRWTGTVHPDGTFSANGKNYPYLFWEGERKQSLQPDFSSGFVVNRDEVVPFLEKQLTAMGMNEKEQTDFITFWGPIMAQNERGFAHFIFNDDYNSIASMNVSPKPDHLFRVYLLWTPLEDGQHLSPTPQSIPSITREGFYIVEWGGSEIVQSNQTALK